jgi:uncharacterized RDD family membrane protein YckC
MARAAEPALEFRSEHEDEQDFNPEPVEPPAPAVASGSAGVPTGGGRRAIAAFIDHSILLAIDLAIVYFTLRMAGLDAGAIRALPAAPLLTFLVLLKLSYFIAFTAVGGQTIGKMAVGIRVVGDRGPVDGATAVRRTFAFLLSLLPLGVGFLPAFFGQDRRALHDRLTRTRVVGLPSA